MTAKEDAGSVAVVTGGARGIGLGCAMALAAKGSNLALVDVLEAELKEATGKLRATGVRAESFVADVSNFEKAEEVTDDILERYESISVLVNNAGIGSSCYDSDGILIFTDCFTLQISPYPFNGLQTTRWVMAT